jgi:TolB protein
MFRRFAQPIILITLITLVGACEPAATPVPPTGTTVSPTATPMPPTAERLVAECVKAMGGIDKIDALETMRFTQNFPDHAGLIQYEIRRPNRVRMGDELVFDGKQGSWLEGRNADGTLRKAELVPQEEWKDFEVDIAWYVPAFFDYPAEYMGTETLDDIETHKLQVTLPLGAVMTYYLDAQTYLVHRAAARFTMDGQEHHPERTYSDYRWQDGILYPYAFTYEGRTGVFTATMKSIEFNVPLGDERFAVPTVGGGGVLAYCYQPESGLHQIYTINADGSGNSKLINARIGLNHHDWSPDALKIAAVGYIDDTTWSIHVFNADGSNLIRLTGTTGVWDSEPAWSPDGTRIAFTRTYPNQNGRDEIWVMDADGSDQRWIGVEGFAAKWSPDGTRFVYVSSRAGNYDIYTVQGDGTDERRLTDTSANEAFPTWSPDGSRIAFSASTGKFNTIENTRTYEIFVMNADGTGAQQLTNNDVYDDYPRWSPDGRLIAFGSDRSASQHWEIYVMNADGADVRRVTTTPSNATAINAVWRPDR